MADKPDFIALFVAEAQERLTKMDSAIIKLENKPDEIELIKELNREAHSLKGSARAFEFNNIQDIAHLIEDIFDDIIAGKLSVTPGMIDLVLTGLDSIREILTKKDTALKVEHICRKLESFKKAENFITHPAGKEKDSSDKVKRSLKKPAEITTPAQTKTAVEESKDSISETEQKKENKPAKSTPAESGFIRVPLNKVNTLLDLMGEVTVDRKKVSGQILDTKNFINRLKSLERMFLKFIDRPEISNQLQSGSLESTSNSIKNSIQQIHEDFKNAFEVITEDLYYMDPIIGDLQTRIKDLRMLPCSTIFESYPRVVRDLAVSGGKKIKLTLTGDDTELDMKMIEAVKDPLMHIIRNCVDHGIELPETRKLSGKPEEGNLLISAEIKGANTVITIKDDGAGIDLNFIRKDSLEKGIYSQDDLNRMSDDEILNTVFLSGYSSSKVITDISGRGIGLDIVKREIEKLQGQIHISTEKGVGTVFAITLPITISVFKVVLIKANNILFAVPMSSIDNCMKVSHKDISTVEGKMAIEYSGSIIPVVHLKDVLQLPDSEDSAENNEDGQFLMILNSMNVKVAFIIDRIVGDREVFIKNLGSHAGKIPNISGAAILENGETILTLDTSQLVTNSSKAGFNKKEFHKTIKKDKSPKRILVVDDSFSTRELTRSILETNDYPVDTAIDGLDALDKLAQTPYSLIVSDVQMPRMDGFELCRTVKSNEQLKDIPVIIVTSLEKEEDKKRGIEVGASFYVVKGNFKQETLLEAIERLI